jgi:hypothetical protein
MLSAIRNTSLLVVFLCELAVLASACYWGFTVSSNWTVKVVAGLGAPLVFVAVWAVFGAANGAKIPLHGLGRAILEIVWFGGGAALLAAAGKPRLAIVFVAAYLLVTAILRLWLK